MLGIISGSGMGTDHPTSIISGPGMGTDRLTSIISGSGMGPDRLASIVSGTWTLVLESQNSPVGIFWHAERGFRNFKMVNFHPCACAKQWFDNKEFKQWTDHNQNATIMHWLPTLQQPGEYVDFNQTTAANQYHWNFIRPRYKLKRLPPGPGIIWCHEYLFHLSFFLFLFFFLFSLLFSL